MKIKIIKGTENSVAGFFSSPSNTPETDDQPIIYAVNDYGYQVPCVDLEFSRRLERERDEARADAAQLADRLSGLELRTTEELARLERERNEWSAMCGRYKQERDEVRKQNAKLRDIAERAIKLIPPEIYGEHSYAKGILSAELDQIKEGAK
jgi:hypothetical protein